ncbi:MAG: SDR family oxidoreductase [Nonomuraea sp.]|nr:SDR family oxidoreductase [Streptomyces sp.]NUP79030.1 SDR family oxidoreductase [Nonomuraea sp.]
MGAATARRCATDGARVVLTDVLIEEGTATAKDLDALFLPHDVTDPDRWAAVVSATVEAHGRLDGLVNNAGIATLHTIEQQPLEEFERVLQVNLVGVFLGLKAVVGAMRASGGGAVVNLSSVAGLTALPGTGGYGASKWGVRGLTKIAALEFGRDRIRVNSVHPGMIVTPMTASLGAVSGEGTFPLAAAGRWGEPEEVAAAIAFLLSDAASYVTGAELAIDGGWTAGESALLGPLPPKAAPEATEPGADPAADPAAETAAETAADTLGVDTPGADGAGADQVVQSEEARGGR